MIVDVRLELKDDAVPNLGDRDLKRSLHDALNVILMEHDQLPLKNWLSKHLVGVHVD